jgi:hypothetical protein
VTEPLVRLRALTWAPHHVRSRFHTKKSDVATVALCLTDSINLTSFDLEDSLCKRLNPLISPSTAA